MKRTASRRCARMGVLRRGAMARAALLWRHTSPCLRGMGRARRGAKYAIGEPTGLALATAFAVAPVLLSACYSGEPVEPVAKRRAEHCGSSGPPSYETSSWTGRRCRHRRGLLPPEMSCRTPSPYRSRVLAGSRGRVCNPRRASSRRTLQCQSRTSKADRTRAIMTGYDVQPLTATRKAIGVAIRRNYGPKS